MRLLFAAVLLILAIKAHATYNKCYRTRHACKVLDGVGLNKDDVCDGQEVAHNSFIRHSHICKCCFANIDCGSTGCPDGFFQVPGSNKCYKYFDDKKRTWDEANTYCQAEGLVLAMTDNNNEIALRNYIVDTLYVPGGYYYTWLGAKADGSVFVWEQTGTSTIPAGSPRFYYESPRLGKCLALYSRHAAPRLYPEETFYSYDCDNSGYGKYTLCEKV